MLGQFCSRVTTGDVSTRALSDYNKFCKFLLLHRNLLRHLNNVSMFYVAVVVVVVAVVVVFNPNVTESIAEKKLVGILFLTFLSLGYQEV